MSEPSRTFDADALRCALDELCERLQDAEVAAGICIVGGAAIALTVSPERLATHDIDVVIYPQSATAAVLDVVAEIAVVRGWPNDWLSNAVRGFLISFLTIGAAWLLHTALTDQLARTD